MSKPLYTIQQAIDAMKSFCAYQERSQSEVRRKLSGGMLTDDEIESVIAELISQNYINETRFAELYIQSKINQKKWGLLKIKQGLKLHGLSSTTISSALKKINLFEYESNALKVLNKLLPSGLPKSKATVEQTVRKMYAKGYEPELTRKLLSKLK